MLTAGTHERSTLVLQSCDVQQVENPGNRLRMPLVILAVLQVLDIATTHHLLQVGGVEGNPIAAALLALGGFTALIIAKGVILAGIAVKAALVARLGDEALARALRRICVVAIIYTAVVGWNTYLMTVR